MKKFTFVFSCLCVCFAVLLLIPAFLPAKVRDKRESGINILPEYVTIVGLNGEQLRLSEEKYVLLAVGSQLSPQFENDAIAAFAVVCRTNLMRSRNTAHAEKLSGNVYAEADSLLLQIKGEEEIEAKWGEQFGRLSAVISETQGEVLLYENSPILAAYHQISPNGTESAENIFGADVPYLRHVASDDSSCEEYERTVTFEREQFDQIALDSLACVRPESGGSTASFSDIKLSEAGTVLSCVLYGKKLTGRQVAQAFSLPSSAFSVRCDSSAVEFVTYGAGHGVGLSISGSNLLARGKLSYREILRKYYPETEIGEG
jgi:stage II sporulation protein D